MILRYYGHSFFTAELASGKTVAMDPYGELYQFPARKVAADITLISHSHFDHCGKESIIGPTRYVEAAGKTRIDEVRITGVPTFHDDAQGQKRGENLFFVIEAEGLRIGHAGDLGQVLSDGQLTQIGRLDVLLMPVGGFYTTSLDDTLHNIRRLQPRVTIPMHYRTQYNPEMPIAPLAEFLDAVGAQDTQMPLLRITAQDISERPACLTLQILP